MNINVNISDDLIINEGYLRVYPNPANEYITVGYHSNFSEEVTLSVFDIHGKLRATFNDGKIGTGDRSITINLKSLNLEAGKYIVNLASSGKKKTAVIIYSPN